MVHDILAGNSVAVVIVLLWFRELLFVLRQLFEIGHWFYIDLGANGGNGSHFRLRMILFHNNTSLTANSSGPYLVLGANSLISSSSQFI